MKTIVCTKIYGNTPIYYLLVAYKLLELFEVVFGLTYIKKPEEGTTKAMEKTREIETSQV